MASVVRGYYGKLPLSPEFLRLHAAGPELRWLDDWLQRGVLYAKSREAPQWSTLVTQSEVWNFLYAPTDGQRIVCGAICMSQDKAGRSFPFLTFFLLEDQTVHKDLFLVPIMVGPRLEELKALLYNLKSFLDWPEFCRKLDAVQDPHLNLASALEEFERYLRTTTVKGYGAGRVVGNSDHVQEHVGLRFLEAVKAVKRSGNGSFLLGLKLPLEVGERTAAYDVSFWIAAMTRSISRQSQPFGLVMFWNRNPKFVAPCAMATWGPGPPHIVRFLVSPNAQDDSWRDIQAEQHREASVDAPSGPFNSSEASLQLVLEYLAMRA